MSNLVTIKNPTLSQQDLVLVTNRLKTESNRIIHISGEASKAIGNHIITLMKAVHEQNVDYHLISEFYNGLDGRSINKTTLKEFIVEFSPLRWNKEKGCFIRTKKERWTSPKLEQAANIGVGQYIKAKKERRETAFDADKKLKSLANSVSKLIEEFNANSVDAAILRTILDALDQQ